MLVYQRVVYLIGKAKLFQFFLNTWKDQTVTHSQPGFRSAPVGSLCMLLHFLFWRFLFSCLFNFFLQLFIFFLYSCLFLCSLFYFSLFNVYFILSRFLGELLNMNRAEEGIPIWGDSKHLRGPWLRLMKDGWWPLGLPRLGNGNHRATTLVISGCHLWDTNKARQSGGVLQMRPVLLWLIEVPK